MKVTSEHHETPVFDGVPCNFCSLTFKSSEARDKHQAQEHRWGHHPNRGQANRSFDFPTYVPQNTACKHGLEDCEICGTTSRRDVRHATVGGKGLIARLR
jgi:hypothetical protein